MAADFNYKVARMENPDRLAILQPAQTLMKAGLDINMTVADIGAGTGIFSFAAAEITGSTVYALEIAEEMLELISNRCKERNIGNIVTCKIEGDYINLPGSSIDLVIMSNVLHNVENKALELKEINRILKVGGRLLLIEWRRKETKGGPPFSKRIEKEDAVSLGLTEGLIVISEMEFGENHYGLVFQK